MRILHVYLHVHSDKIDAFKQLATYNAGQAIQEPGCRRFDVLQQEEDPTRFMLIEHYDDEAAVESHRQTEHFARWSREIGNFLVEERTRSWWQQVN